MQTFVSSLLVHTRLLTISSLPFFQFRLLQPLSGGPSFHNLHRLLPRALHLLFLLCFLSFDPILPPLASAATITTGAACISADPNCFSCMQMGSNLKCIQCNAGMYLFSSACYSDCSLFPGYREAVVTLQNGSVNSTCSPCPTGFYDANAYGPVANCTLVSSCIAGQYVAQTATAISDLVCANLSSVCSTSQYIISLPVNGANALCNPTTACTLPFVEYQAPTYTSDRICIINVSSSSCPSGMYKITNPILDSSSSNTSLCSPSSECNAVLQYQAVAPTATTNRVCKLLTSCINSCSEGLFLQGLCSCPSNCYNCVSNNTLSYCTVCGNGYYLYQGACFPTCDSIPNSTPSGSGSLGRLCIVENPQLLSSTIALEYQSSAQTLTTDRVCSLVSTCGSNQWQVAAATSYSNVVCLNTTLCSNNQYQVSPPTTNAI